MQALVWGVKLGGSCHVADSFVDQRPHNAVPDMSPRFPHTWCHTRWLPHQRTMWLSCVVQQVKHAGQETFLVGLFFIFLQQPLFPPCSDLVGGELGHTFPLWWLPVFSLRIHSSPLAQDYKMLLRTCKTPMIALIDSSHLSLIILNLFLMLQFATNCNWIKLREKLIIVKMILFNSKISYKLWRQVK